MAAKKKPAKKTPAITPAVTPVDYLGLLINAQNKTLALLDQYEPRVTDPAELQGVLVLRTLLTQERLSILERLTAPKGV